LYTLSDALGRATKYASKLPPAISGSGGHRQTFSVACTLVRVFGGELTEEELLELLEVLEEWNATCAPPWSDHDLRRKLRDAFRRATPKERQERAKPQRQQWPDLREGTTGELEKLAALRGYSIAGLESASEQGFLRFGRWRDRAAWFVADPEADVCQARA
jgi:hypothetical protein